MSCPFPFHVGRHRCCDHFWFFDVWCLNYVGGNPGGERRHTGFEAVSPRWGGASISCQKDKKSRLLFELTFKYLESNNHIPGVKLLIPTTVQTGGVPGVGGAVLMTTGPPTSAYYICILQVESHFCIGSNWKMNNLVLYTDDKLLRKIHYFYLLHMCMQELLHQYQ